MRNATIAAMLLAVAVPNAAGAQFKLPGGLGGMPGLGSAGMGNVAGLLGYCVKNKLLGSLGGAAQPKAGGTAGGAAGILGRLTGKPGVTQSPGFALGQAGRIEQPGGGSLSLDGIQGKLKAQLCNQVLQRAGSFL